MNIVYAFISVFSRYFNMIMLFFSVLCAVGFFIFLLLIPYSIIKHEDIGISKLQKQAPKMFTFVYAVVPTYILATLGNSWQSDAFGIALAIYATVAIIMFIYSVIKELKNGKQS